MAEATNASKSSEGDSDHDFDLSAEMLVNDFDDEYTMAEEEAFESADSVTNELDDLQREGEMPLDEVLAMYGGYDSSVDDSVQEIVESDSSIYDSPDHTMESHSSSHSILTPSHYNSHESDSSLNLMDIRRHHLDEFGIPYRPSFTSMGSSGPLLRSVHQTSESSDTGTDYDYSPDEDWRKTIQVGSEFQAVIPEGLSPYDDVPAYENEDRLVWDPSVLPCEKVEDFLLECRFLRCNKHPPPGYVVHDDEQALFLLLQCGHNKEEALRRRRLQPVPAPDVYIFSLFKETMSLWSEDECRNFENGLKAYGKDFHLIQMNKVRTRAVSEVVHFYYLWKKTERHDIFAHKNRIGKKKYALHPGTTDYMDKFLDEQENLLRESSNLPMFDDMKRTPLTSPEPNADSSTHHGFDTDGPSSTSTYSNSATSTCLEQDKLHSGMLSDGSRDSMNCDDKVSSTTPTVPKENIICINLEPYEGVNENQPDKVANPPTCSNILKDITTFQEGCNFRFDYGKDNNGIE